MNPKSTAAALAAAALLTAACGRLDDGPGSGGDVEISHPIGANELVLRIETGGGFVAVESTLAALPGVSIYGDGRMIVQGPVIEIYPGPALPNLQVTRLSEDAIQAILAAARNAGLLDGDASYDYPCVTDVGTTTFTVNAEGRSNVVSAYALGFDQGGCPGVDEEARAALVGFQADLGDPRTLVPEGSIGEEEPYAPTEMRVFVLPYRGDPTLPQEPVLWPVQSSLDTFGEPLDVPEGVRCGVVGGGELPALLEAATSANQLTPWTGGGIEHGLIFRPLLPDEHGC